jgi:dTDP-glucose 4,6-dehydratase
MRLLVTGGAGFIGSNFVRYVLGSDPKITVTNFDKLTYAGNLASLTDVQAKHKDRYRFIKGDICDAEAVKKAMADVDMVIHFAAESHVDRSILSAVEFIETNIRGTYTLLEAARQAGVKRFTHVSTDEVYGALGETGSFTEETPLAPNSPYSASKAGSDMMARAYVHTHGMDVVTTRCSNNYGPYHFPEKLIPLMITNATEGKPLPVYGDGRQVRDWIYVEDHCSGVWAAATKGKKGEVYNLGGESEVRNIEVVKSILKIMGKPDSLIKYVEDRKGHDFRYSIDCSKAKRELGWRPTVKFEEGSTP